MSVWAELAVPSSRLAEVQPADLPLLHGRVSQTAPGSATASLVRSALQAQLVHAACRSGCCAGSKTTALDEEAYEAADA